MAFMAAWRAIAAVRFRPAAGASTPAPADEADASVLLRMTGGGLGKESDPDPAPAPAPAPAPISRPGLARQKDSGTELPLWLFLDRLAGDATPAPLCGASPASPVAISTSPEEDEEEEAKPAELKRRTAGGEDGSEDTPELRRAAEGLPTTVLAGDALEAPGSGLSPPSGLQSATFL